MQTWAGITGSGGSVRIHFTEVKFEVGGMEHTQFTGKHSKWHGHTRHCARPLTITHTRTHTAGFVSAASRGPIFAASSSTAPASGSKEGKRIKCWSTSQFRLQSQGWNRGRWDNAISCLPMSEWCNVSWQRNAQGQWGGTNGNQSKVHKAQVKPPDWNNDGTAEEQVKERRAVYVRKSLQLHWIGRLNRTNIKCMQTKPVTLWLNASEHFFIPSRHKGD